MALADLDDDGRIDIALAGLRAPATLLWNRGGLAFKRTVLEETDTRAVAVVDGDDAVDLVFTRANAAPSWWRGAGARRFARDDEQAFAGPFPIYAMDWADLDGDQDLDMVGASYNSELLSREPYTATGGQRELPAPAGLFVYENDGSALLPQLLSGVSQALAVTVFDVNGDGLLDIVSGNDFAVPDYVFIRQGTGWQPASPFAVTTRNTMSFALGDLDNDGRDELLATDMLPYGSGAAVDAAWQPLRDAAEANRATIHALSGDDADFEAGQKEANVLHRRAGAGFVDDAARARVAATGWTWSAQFGDLDNDGDLDLYAVNGMIAQEMLGYLPNAELVEKNQALRNDGAGRFEPAPEWGLGATESGRGMAMADLDNDGDLDIVVNNLAAAAVLFENQLCSEGTAVEIDLHWSGSANTRALGARVKLATSAGRYARTVRASSGYLSSNPARVHVGLPPAAAALALTVRWPEDGVTSHLGDVAAGRLIKVTRR